VEVTVRDLSAVYAHVQRAVADPDGRVRLEGDITGVRRVATALGVGSAGETHFLFGDDRFSPWGNEFERAASREGLQPQDPVRAGQARDWIDAMVPRLGLRDEVAGLVVLVWAALRQRAWYQHRRRDPGTEARSVRARWNCGPSRCPRPPTGRQPQPRGAVFGITSNPFLTAAGVAELAGKLSDEATARADIVSTLASRVESPHYLGLSEKRPVRQAKHGTACAELAESLRRAPGPGRPGDLPEAALPATEAALAKSLITRATNVSRAARLPLGSTGTADAAAQGNRRARQGGRQDSGGAPQGVTDEFSVRLVNALADTDQAVFDWLAEGQPPGSRRSRAVGEGWQGYPVQRQCGQTSHGRAAIVPDQHPDEDVTVEWRVNG
jgi:hypothetical protein